MNEKIELEDMKDYDSEMYASLKWISENDPKPLMMTFVDCDDIELCNDGKNIELNESNKEKFINLMIEKKLIKQNINAIDQIKLGFNETIDSNIISILKASELKEIINGKNIQDMIINLKKITTTFFQSFLNGHKKNFRSY